MFANVVQGGLDRGNNLLGLGRIQLDRIGAGDVKAQDFRLQNR